MDRSIKRRRKEVTYAVESSAPGWMTTYGDMVTLILAFFVILFSISTVDANKFDLALLSLQKALGILPGGRTVSSDSLIHMSELEWSQQTRLADIRQLMYVERTMKDRLSEQDAVEMHLDERGLVVRFVEDVLFDSGKADLKTSAARILKTVAGVIEPLPNHIRVEGHTDNVPINTKAFPSNWELSTARATQVIQFLLAYGISPLRLSAAGYGEYRPVETNDTPEGRQRNRRVDIVILRLSASRVEPLPAVPDNLPIE